MPQEPLHPLRESRLSMNKEAANRYSGAIFLAGGWLEKRGISDETAESFRLGVVTNPIPGHERYEGWLSIPYLDYRDRVLKVRFRCLGEHGGKCKDFGHGKYIDLPHEVARVFNTKALHDPGEEVHICEGELDSVILTQAGLNAIALPGANQWRYHHTRMLADYSKVYVWADADDAGSQFASDVLSSMSRADQVRLPPGLDVNDYFLREGVDGLWALKDQLDELTDETA